MKHIKLFYLKHCPFCRKAFAYIDELKQDPKYADIEIETIEEEENPEVANSYDYYYVPTFYINEEKVHEGGIFKEEVQAIFDKAI
jgi:glutaredoxin